jgi:hypothetical protein
MLTQLHEQPTTRGTAARRGFSFSRAIHAATLAVALSCLTSCSGPKNFLNSNDDLRRENLALKRKAEELQKLLDQRLKQIEAMEQSPGPATRPAVTGVRPMDLPRVVGVSFDSYTGTIDTNSDDIDDTLRLYVLTVDQLGRFLPVAGKAVVQVVYIPEKGEPIEVIRKEYDPAALTAAYRTGLGGTHYTLESPLPDTLPKGKLNVTVKLTFTDASTGTTLTHEQTIPVKR